MRNKYFCLSIALILAFGVVILGAYTRLTHAGLGCPDWPGCYGHLVLPKTPLPQTQATYPDWPIESEKAWTEMIHRYAAGSLALIVFSLFFVSVWRKFLAKRMKDSQNFYLLLGLSLLLVFQALLGMWTVTMKLLPVVVMGHLLGGILIFSLLTRLLLQNSRFRPEHWSGLHGFIALGALIVLLQIALGGWVSANYAGIACVGFPQCNGQWVPRLNFSTGFYLFSPLGPNYQGGLLDVDARISIQFIHRLGALITTLYLVSLSVYTLAKASYGSIKLFALVLLGLIALQILLGILNVLYLLPLPIALAHNGVAALLMATILSMHYLTKGKN